MKKSQIWLQKFPRYVRVLNYKHIHSCKTYNSVFLQWSDRVQLSDIKQASELEYLNVKQLKNLLSTNRVDYKGCIERQELLNRVSRLWQEYKQSRQGKILKEPPDILTLIHILLILMPRNVVTFDKIEL